MTTVTFPEKVETAYTLAETVQTMLAIAVIIGTIITAIRYADPQRKAAHYLALSRCCSGVAYAAGTASIRAELAAHKVIEDAKL